MTTIYQGSKGPVEIASMPHKYLASALAKLLRERKGEERQDEVDAMTARLDVLDAEFAAKADGIGAHTEPTPETVALEAELEPNPREVIGGNNPPVDTPFAAIKCHLDDLLVEAHNWADGQVVETQEQADTVNRLKADLLEGAGAAEAERVKEKKPLDEKIDEIQTRYNVYLAPLKNKVPGKVMLALDALRAALTPFLQKVEAEQKAVADAARKEADDKAAAALAAIRQAPASDLGARMAAEDLVTEAARAATVAKQAEGAKAHARGGVRATGLKSDWKATMADRKAALIYYAKTRPMELTAFLQGLADKDVTAGARSIPGFNINEERRAA